MLTNLLLRRLPFGTLVLLIVSSALSAQEESGSGNPDIPIELGEPKIDPLDEGSPAVGGGTDRSELDDYIYRPTTTPELFDEEARAIPAPIEIVPLVRQSDLPSFGDILAERSAAREEERQRRFEEHMATNNFVFVEVPIMLMMMADDFRDAWYLEQRILQQSFSYDTLELDMRENRLISELQSTLTDSAETLGTGTERNGRVTTAWVPNAVYQAGNYLQHIDVRLRSITGTGCNATVSVRTRSEGYYAPPGGQYGEWETIEVGFMGPVSFSVDVSAVGDCQLAGEVRFFD
ncbi:hypothetical protein [Roseobacter weihaiensis]|uniref:hypothetical protein n=1 Tax=Roseobacter weihaiensis TaxID=2763262 RepID=UPI001D0A26D9|nr:hypothetical protein [Roseobacter sp. H9]